MLSSVFLDVREAARPKPTPFVGPLGVIITPIARLVWFIDRWILEPLILQPVDWMMRAMARVYYHTLRIVLRHQWLFAGVGGLIGLLALVFAFGVSVPLPGGRSAGIKPVGRELVPSEDQSRFVVNVICPVGSSIDYVDEMVRHGENILAGLKDPVTGEGVIATTFGSASIRPGSLITEGIVFVRLISRFDEDGVERRTMHQSDVMNTVRRAYAAIPGVRAIALDLSTQGFTPTRGYPIDFAVQGPDWETVTRLAEKITSRLVSSGFVTDVNSDYRPGMPEAQVFPDRIKAAEAGVSVQRIGFVLGVGIGGLRDGRFTDGDRRYDVRVRYLETQRDSPDQLADLYVKSESGKLVPLRDLVTVEVKSTLPIINRYNHLRKVELTANMAPGTSQGEAIQKSLALAEQVRDEMGLPPSYRFVQLGNAQAMAETIDSLWGCLVLGFVVAAMILGVQFNSFVHPFTVLLAVPFGVTGALATLWLCGDTLNMMSMIGMILLAGLVKKNSIILVDFANHLRADGRSPEAAMLEAGPVRMRPIIMTTLATVVGALPLALGVGPGAETRAPLARSIIGGSILSTLVTLVIVPVFYVLFDRMGAWFLSASERTQPNRKERGERKEENRETSPEPSLVEVVSS